MIINIPSFILCLVFPVVFIEQLGGVSSGGMELDLVRWYGVVLFVLTFILGKALWDKNLSALRIIFMGYAIGDLIQLLVTWKMADHLSGWNFSLIFTAILSLLLFTARMLSLKNQTRLGF